MDIFKYRQADSYLVGGEAGMHFHPKRIEWLHLETTYAMVIARQKQGEYLPFVPAHKLKFELRAEKEKLWFMHHAFVSVNTCTAFDQNRVAPDETATVNYTLLDVSLGGSVRVKKDYISIILSANNLLDKKYIDHLSTLEEVNLFNPGRNISLTLRIPFGAEKKH
jgi:iron complex outermembrane receptor protein